MQGWGIKWGQIIDNIEFHAKWKQFFFSEMEGKIWFFRKKENNLIWKQENARKWVHINAYWLYKTTTKRVWCVLRLTLCDPMDCSTPGSSVHGDSLGKNTGGGCHFLLQGIFPTQGSNPGLLNCRWILNHLSHQESP